MSIAFIAFLSLFALDVFGEQRGFWGTALALMMHLIPSFVLVMVLILAWRWEWIGAGLYAAAGLLYVLMMMSRTSPAASVRAVWVLTIAGPAFLIAALFLANWLRHGELHPPRT